MAITDVKHLLRTYNIINITHAKICIGRNQLSLEWALERTAWTPLFESDLED